MQKEIKSLNQKSFTLPLLLSPLIFLLVAGTGVYYLKSAEIDAAMQVVTDETATWKTFSSDRFSFRYPDDLTLEKRQDNFFVLLIDKNNPMSVLMSIDARVERSNANFENAVSSAKSGLTDTQVELIPGGVKVMGKVGPGFGEGQPITIALMELNDGAVIMETTSTDQKQLDIFEKVLKTFKVKN